MPEQNPMLFKRTAKPSKEQHKIHDEWHQTQN